MKKRTKTFIAAALGLCLLLGLSACGKTLMTLDMAEDGKSCNITVDAAKDTFAMSGTLEVEKGENIYADFDLEGDGMLSVRFISDSDLGVDEGADADLENLEEPDAEATMDVTVEGADSDMYDIPPGTYYVYVTAETKVKGTCKITVKK